MAIPNIEFQSRIFVSGSIIATTGLHIGGNSTEMSIGGVDKIVVRDPITNHPYIPGSSLRGKMRSLLERLYGEMNIKLDMNGNTINANGIQDMTNHLAKGAKLKSAGPSVNKNTRAGKLFGIPVDQREGNLPEDIIPQRLVVRDAKLMNANVLEKARNTDMPFTEVKTEVAIDRITSEANPRQIERVPAGAEFRFEFVLSLFGDDDEQEYVNLLFECMELLQDDYLGGNGSRGYGRIQFDIQELKKKTVENYRNREPAQTLDFQIPETLTIPKEPSIAA